MDRKAELGEGPTTHTVTDKKGKVKYRKEGVRGLHHKGPCGSGESYCNRNSGSLRTKHFTVI